MPEGPEIKTVARTLAQEIVGKQLGNFWHSEFRLRKYVDYSSFKRLENMTISSVSCYGKMLFIDADQKPALMAQLGMTGQLTVALENEPTKAHTHIRWKLLKTRKELRYIDPRRFGLLDLCNAQQKNAIIKKLGPDPFLMHEKDHAPLINAMKRSTRTIKEVLLDQSVIAGVGNIYASEALFLAKINPKRRACDIEASAYKKLVLSTIDVMQQAYKNAGTTFSNYVDASGQKGRNLNFLKVFQRAGLPCVICKTPIVRTKQGGRSTFYCSQCQAN